MPVVKSFKVKSKGGQDGDMFYIMHGSDNFTCIDCCLDEDRKEEIISEIKDLRAQKGIFRFISTHPDDDHICGIKDLNAAVHLDNFYCVKNCANNPQGEEDFRAYCDHRDGKGVFHIFKDCSRCWMNKSNEERKCSGINILWPDTTNKAYTEILEQVKDWNNVNNLSPIISYSIANSATFLWFGDMETNFMEQIAKEVKFDEATVLFAPHHGRKSGRVIDEWLAQIKPRIIVIGSAPCEHLDYYDECNEINHYDGYCTITQNRAGDIAFETDDDWLHIFVSNRNYEPTFRVFDMRKPDAHGCHYIGSINIK